MQGVFLLLAFTCLGHECQDLWSQCNGMHVSADWTLVYTLIQKSFGGMESEPMLTSWEKYPLLEKILRGGLNPWRCIKQDSEPNTLSLSYSGSQPSQQWFKHQYSSGYHVTCLVLHQARQPAQHTTNELLPPSPSTTPTPPQLTAIPAESQQWFKHWYSSGYHVTRLVLPQARQWAQHTPMSYCGSPPVPSPPLTAIPAESQQWFKHWYSSGYHVTRLVLPQARQWAQHTTNELLRSPHSLPSQLSHSSDSKTGTLVATTWSCFSPCGPLDPKSSD